MRHIRFTIPILASLLLAIVSWSAPSVSAQSQSSVISRGLKTQDNGIVIASLVSATGSSSSDVSLATTGSANRLVGIVTKASLVELSDNKKGEVQIAISGIAIGLVSDINGSIRVGDKITISPIDGVGMLATNDSQIVGAAAANFDAKSAHTKTITDRSGKQHSVRVGSVPIQVGIAYYVAPNSKLLPPFLQNLANNIAGRPVSVTRILFSSILLLLAFISIFALIYTSVRAGIISIGRNPLAAGVIQRSLIGVAITTLLVFAFALLATYLILIY